MIRREDVADLQPGDVVEVAFLAWPEVAITGPLRRHGSGMWVGPVPTIAASGGLYETVTINTVVSRAPRPLFVNHPRTEPVGSDVMRREGDDPWRMFGYSGDRWVLVGGTHEYETTDLQGAPFRLLVDGETGDTVPAVQA